MKFAKKVLIFLIILIAIFFITYLGIYLYAKFSDKLPINTANNYYLYDKEIHKFNIIKNIDTVIYKDKREKCKINNAMILSFRD